MFTKHLGARCVGALALFVATAGNISAADPAVPPKSKAPANIANNGLAAAEAIAASLIPGKDQIEPIDPVVGQQIAGLLQNGFSNRKVPITELEAEANAIAAMAPAEPRGPLAWALVLWKRGRAKLVPPVLEQACHAGDDVYFPAWETAIWFYLRPDTADEAIDRIIDVAGKIDRFPDRVQGVADSRVAAGWLGRVTAASEFLATSDKDVARWSATDQKLRVTLRGPLNDAYRDAHDDTLALAEQLSADSARKTADAKVEQQVLADQTRQDAETKAADLQLEQNQLEADRRALSRDLEQRLQKISEQLTGLEEDFTQLQAARAQLQAGIVQIEAQLATLAQQPRLPGRSGELEAARIQLLIQQLTIRSGQLQTESWRCLQSQLRISRQAERLINERDGMVRAYERQFGKFEQQERKLQNWAERLTKLKAESDDMVTGKNPASRAAQLKARSLATYVGFDLADVRQKILNDCVPPPDLEDGSSEPLDPLFPPPPAP